MALISLTTDTPSSTFDLAHDDLPNRPVGSQPLVARDDRRSALLTGLAYLGLLITGGLGYMAPSNPDCCDRRLARERVWRR